jgi:hypothetical protein
MGGKMSVRESIDWLGKDADTINQDWNAFRRRAESDASGPDPDQDIDERTGAAQVPQPQQRLADRKRLSGDEIQDLVSRFITEKEKHRFYSKEHEHNGIFWSDIVTVKLVHLYEIGNVGAPGVIEYNIQVDIATLKLLSLTKTDSR